MYKIVSLVVICFFVSSCRFNAGIVNSEHVSDMLITINGATDTSAVKHYRISDEQTIKRIIRELNNGWHEPLIFYPTHILLIKYKDNKVISISCNGHGLLDNEGRTYRMKKTIEEILKQP